MKKLVLTLALGFCMSAAVFAQGNVPEKVKSHFSSNYAQATDVDWKHKDDGYVAKFKMNGKEEWVMYDAEGMVMKKGHEIPASELPQAVTNAIKKEHPNRTIEKGEMVEEGGKTMYSAKIEGHHEDMKHFYNADGTVVKDKHHKEHKEK